MGIVSIVKCDEYNEQKMTAALNETFKNLGGIEKFVKPGMKVLLKPNLVMRKHPEAAATTHPVLVKVLSRMIINAGGSVILADSPGGAYNEKTLKSTYSVCGMEAAAEEAGIKLNYDLSVAEVDNAEGIFLKKVTVIKPLTDADLVINLPKLKTHGQMMYTGAVKNMFGSIPGVLKAEYHLRMSKYDEFANAIIDIFLSVKPALTIMDAVMGMDGAGPTAGRPKHIGLVLASENAFELDFTALTIVKADPMNVPIIRHAVERGLCPDNIKNITPAGEIIKNVRVNGFNMPDLKSLKAIQFYDKGMFKGVIDILRPKPVFIHKSCVGCSECAKNCPAHVISMRNGKPEADLTGCIRCFCCQELCPAKAINIKRMAFLKPVVDFCASFLFLFEIFSERFYRKK